MMKLIATTFLYTVDGPTRIRPDTRRGSYLGRKPATVLTIRQFLRSNAKIAGLPYDRHTDIVVLGSSVSPWRLK